MHTYLRTFNKWPDKLYASYLTQERLVLMPSLFCASISSLAYTESYAYVCPQSCIY